MSNEPYGFIKDVCQRCDIMSHEPYRHVKDVTYHESYGYVKDVTSHMSCSVCQGCRHYHE